MQQRLTMVTLGVEDLQKIRTFYEEVFGWKATGESNENVVFFKLNCILLGLYGREALAEDATVDAEGSGFKSFALAYNLRSEAEVDALFEELETKGVRIVKPPEKVFWGGYSGYLADPEDNLWEIAHNPFMELDEDGNVV